MSYDVYLVCPTCGNEVTESWNYTFNISPMLYHENVGIKIKEWHDRLARSIVPELEKGINALMENPERYEAMNPENGWGSYRGLLDRFLWPMLKAFKEHPKAIVQIWV